MGFLSNLFGGGPKVSMKELVQKGAVIVDVRTPGEFQGGHIKGAINIPLQTLEKGMSKLKKEQTIITCCASGMRSASARGILKSKGYTDVHNGGGWSSLNSKL
jgi:rhodanese-related sulfurtransferase